MTILVAAATARGAAAQTVTVNPKQPLIERTRAGQSLSIDFIVENPGPAGLELLEVRLQVFDRRGHLVVRKQAQAGIDAELPGGQTIAPNSKLLVLAPFNVFDTSIELGKLAYELVFQADDQGAARRVIPVDVVPRAFQPRTSLVLPVSGRVLVDEAHDFYAHHRREDLTSPVFADILHVTVNPVRYAYDLCVSDARGRVFVNEGKHNENWLGFGAPILAPAAGIVKESRNDIDDHVIGVTSFDIAGVLELAATDPLAALKLFLGNYVVIDHGNGELSVLAHLKKGSVTVRSGDSVRAGQHIAGMGNSGDSDFPHLHYQLTTGLALDSETLPSYFDKLILHRGEASLPNGDVALDSGDFVQTSR